ncbi:MAG: hypothetical protein JSU86_17465 [Phycisphaerales bacterium]|nr:MAG: hypothetical protein JSU86_17465 [Phycisphaerales bacterium]
MFMTPRAGVLASIIWFMAVPSAGSLAEPPAGIDERERERREALERRLREALESESEALLERRMRDAPKAESEAILDELFGEEEHLFFEGRLNRHKWMPYEIEGPPRWAVEDEQSRRKLDEQLQRLHDELDALRLREIDIRAALEKSKLGLPERDLEALSKMALELMRIQSDLERRELQIARLQRQRGQLERRGRLQWMEQRQHTPDRHRAAFDAVDAVIMATQSVVDIHRDADGLEQAAEVLEELLQRVDEPSARTFIRFTLRDIYMELEQPARAADHLVEIIIENARVLSHRRRQPLSAQD